MSSGTFKDNVTDELIVDNSLIFNTYIYKQDLALNNLQYAVPGFNPRSHHTEDFKNGN